MTVFSFYSVNTFSFFYTFSFRFFNIYNNFLKASAKSTIWTIWRSVSIKSLLSFLLWVTFSCFLACVGISDCLMDTVGDTLWRLWILLSIWLLVSVLVSTLWQPLSGKPHVVSCASQPSAMDSWGNSHIDFCLSLMQQLPLQCHDLSLHLLHSPELWSLPLQHRRETNLVPGITSQLEPVPDIFLFPSGVLLSLLFIHLSQFCVYWLRWEMEQQWKQKTIVPKT